VVTTSSPRRNSSRYSTIDARSSLNREPRPTRRLRVVGRESDLSGRGVPPSRLQPPELAAPDPGQDPRNRRDRHPERLCNGEWPRFALTAAVTHANDGQATTGTHVEKRSREGPFSTNRASGRAKPGTDPTHGLSDQPPGRLTDFSNPTGCPRRPRSDYGSKSCCGISNRSSTWFARSI
jgi:hypothetical protein